MIDLLINVLAGAGIFVTLTGLFFWVMIAKSNRPPMDRSNRIAHLRIVWYALKSPQRFVGLKRTLATPGGEGTRVIVEAFPWLTQDEGDNE